jgi:RimJ/RimL family protein N-acetyltransferase
MQLIEALPTAEHLKFLYKLLLERPKKACISHESMPSYSKHMLFFNSRPYHKWYIAHVDGIPVGAVYMTRRNELGVAIAKEFRGNGYGINAIKEIMQRVRPLREQKSNLPGYFIVNVSPDNTSSISMFKKLGAEHIQNTYRIEP